MLHRPPCRRSIVADQDLRGFLVLSVMFNSIAGCAKPYGSSYWPFFFDLRSEMSEEICREHCWRPRLDLREEVRPRRSSTWNRCVSTVCFARAFLDLNILNLIFRQIQQL